MFVQKIEAATSAPLPALDIPGVDALMKDFATLSSGAAPITFGLFRMSKGEALPYEYAFDEFKIVLDGEVDVTDQSGTVTSFKAGDVIQFTKGAKVVFTTETTALTAYVAQR